MYYMKVKCNVLDSDEVTEIWSEVNEENDEVRKIEWFLGKPAQVTSINLFTFDTSLSLEPLPSIEEINADPEFEAVLIDKDQFELAWEESCRNLGVTRW